MSARRVSNLLGLAVLSYLTQQPMHAYEIQRQLKDNDAASTFKLSYGALYSVVRQLLDAGFISPAGTGRRGNLPKHTVYELTESGRAETRDWLRELLTEPRHEFPAFAAALSLVVVLPPIEVTELLEARIARIGELSAAITEQVNGTVAGGVHPIFLIEDEYRCALLDAEAAFIRRLITRIADPAEGWAESWQSYQQGVVAQADKPEGTQEHHVTRPKTALVIGGGIAGPATAIALRKAGIDAIVFEARPAATDPGGVMLTLATNGIDALKAIGAQDAALGIGFPTPGITLRTHTGKRLGVTPTGSARPDSEISRTIRRADLYAALQEQARDRGIVTEHGRRLVGVEDGSRCVRAVFDDGTTAEADIMIGADGVHSTVRAHIDPAAPRPSYTGLITTGGYAPGSVTASADGGYEMIFGKRAFFGYATAPDGQAWWFVNLPRRPEPERGEVESVSTAQWRRTFAETYSDDSGPALELISATPDFAPMTPIHTVPKLPHWHRDRMIVVGDAAHAPSPTSGQGASLSIEDAVVLAISLRDNDSVSDAFTAFESARRPRVQRIIKAAARINNNKAPGPVGRLFRDLMLPSILRMTANSASNREVFDHHLDWTVQDFGGSDRA